MSSREPHNGIGFVSRGCRAGVDFVMLETPPSKQMWELEEAANIFAPLLMRHWFRSISGHETVGGLLIPPTEIIPGGALSSGWLVTFYA